MNKSLPLVSIIIPCRNEKKSIIRALSSVIEQDYPAHLVETIVVDGFSDDVTISLVQQFARNNPEYNIRIISNPYRTTPYALNIGIAHARGAIIFTFGAHNRYSPNYISEAVRILNTTNAAAVGSVAITLPSDRTPIARAIARVLASPFGVGNSLMRIGRNLRTIRTADTASCPGYRRELFTRFGTFNTRLVRNHDIEFNLRLRRAGEQILLVPSIKTYYYARARLIDLFRNSFANGYWVIRSTRFASKPFSLRHLVPAIFITTLLLATGFLKPLTSSLSKFNLPSSHLIAHLPLLITAGSYLLLLILFSALTTPSPLHLPLYLITYPVLHIGYGLGSLWALLTYWRPSQELPHSSLLQIAGEVPSSFISPAESAANKDGGLTSPLLCSKQQRG